MHGKDNLVLHHQSNRILPVARTAELLRLLF